MSEQIKIGDAFRYYGANVTVVATGGPDDAFPVRNGEIGIRAASRADAEKLEWAPCTNGEYEAISTLTGFLDVAEPSPTTPQDHGPLAATLSDRTLAKVLSRPAYVPPLVLLDAAEHLADVATNALQCLQQAGPWTAAGGGPSVVERLEKALSAYREVTS